MPELPCSSPRTSPQGVDRLATIAPETDPASCTRKTAALMWSNWRSPLVVFGFVGKASVDSQSASRGHTPCGRSSWLSSRLARGRRDFVLAAAVACSAAVGLLGSRASGVLRAFMGVISSEWLCGGVRASKKCRPCGHLCLNFCVPRAACRGWQMSRARGGWVVVPKNQKGLLARAAPSRARAAGLGGGASGRGAGWCFGFGRRAGPAPPRHPLGRSPVSLAPGRAARGGARAREASTAGGLRLIVVNGSGLGRVRCAAPALSRRALFLPVGWRKRHGPCPLPTRPGEGRATDCGCGVWGATVTVGVRCGGCLVISSPSPPCSGLPFACRGKGSGVTGSNLARERVRCCVSFFNFGLTSERASWFFPFFLLCGEMVLSCGLRRSLVLRRSCPRHGGFSLCEP